MTKPSIRFTVTNLREGFDRIDMRIENLDEVTEDQKQAVFDCLRRLADSFCPAPVRAGKPKEDA